MDDKDTEISFDKVFEKTWNIFNKLRGSINLWVFKDYLFSLMFYYYISYDIAQYFNVTERESGALDFDYENLSDESINEQIIKECVDAKGFFIYPSQLFNNIFKKYESNLEELNIGLHDVFNSIERSASGYKSEEYLVDLFTKDFSKKELGENLSSRNKLLFSMLLEIDRFTSSYVNKYGIGIFISLFEYFIDKYILNSKVKKGNFSTPKSIARLLSKLLTTNNSEIKTIYDPACGFGLLLLNLKNELNNQSTICFGQEEKYEIYQIAKMNMFIHNVNYSNFDIKRGDALTNPKHDIRKKYDAIVCTIYSNKWEGKDNPALINDERFLPAGALAPKSNFGLAYIMHILYLLKPSSRAAIICSQSVLYSSGKEKKIREYLVNNNYIDTIISLPNNSFYGPNAPINVVVLSKSKKDNNVLFIDANKLNSFDINGSYLNEKNIDEILEIFKLRPENNYCSKLVSNELFYSNDYNLTPNCYFDYKDKDEFIDNIDCVQNRLNEIFYQKKTLFEKINSFYFSNSKNNFKLLPLWEILICSKKFVNVPKYKQTKTIKINSVSKAKLKSLNIAKGNVKLLSSTHFSGTTTEELAGELLNNKEAISFPIHFNKSINIKYLNGKFVAEKDKLIFLFSKSNLYNLKFIYFFLLYNIGKLENCLLVNTNIKRLDMNRVFDLEIPIPPIKTQNEIVSFLEKISNESISEEIDLIKKIQKYYINKLLTFKGDKNE